MKFIQWLRALFGKKTDKIASQTDPLKPGFDVEAWLDRRQELRERNPEKIDHFVPMGSAVLLGVSDCVTPEQDAEQARRLELSKQQPEVSPNSASTSNRRAS